MSDLLLHHARLGTLPGRWFWIAVALVTAAFMNATAAADSDSALLVYEEQERNVTAWFIWSDGSGGDSENDGAQATDFGPFDAQVTAGGTASQDSSLLGNSIFASGDVEGEISGVGPLSEDLNLASHFEVNFIIGVDTQLELSGLLQQSPFSLFLDASSSLTLISANDGVVYSISGSAPAQAFSESLVLPPGSYSIVAAASISGAACCGQGIHSGHARFALQAHAMTPSDCNNNGIPDLIELNDGRASDCNADGVLDSCEPDCDLNGFPDECELAGGAILDCNANGIPDSCDFAAGGDSNDDGILDDCAGGVIYLAQTRHVVASIETPDNTEMQESSAAGLGPFDADVIATILSASHGQMTSSLHSSGIEAVGSAFSIMDDSLLTVASAECTHDVTFVLDEPTAYEFTGVLVAEGNQFTVRESTCRLTGNRLGTIFDIRCGGPGCAAPNNFEGILSPGTYLLHADARIVSGSGPFPGDTSATASFQIAIAFSSACPSDTDDTGSVDIEDLINVVLDWGTDGSLLGSDVNGSGLVDVDDLVQVILSWGPCPSGS